MPVTTFSDENKKALRTHGHPERWEVVVDSGGTFVECTKCGLTLVQLTDGTEATNTDDPSGIFA